MLMRYVEVWKGLSKYFVFVAAESDMVFDSPSPAEIVAYAARERHLVFGVVELNAEIVFAEFVFNCASEVTRKVDGQVVLAR